MMRVLSRGSFPLLVVAVMVLPLLFMGCGSSQESEASVTGGNDDALVKIINVEVSKLVPTSFEDYIRLTGTVKAAQDVVLSAEEPGILERFDVEKGSRVDKGQAIAKIDDRLLRSLVAEAEAESALAAEQYERQAAVWKEGRIGTEIAYLEKKRRATQAAARLEGLRTRLEKTVVRAPFSGVLDARYIEEGEMAALGSRIGRILSIDKLEIEIGVPERFSPDVRLGTQAYITFDILPGREFEGTIQFVGRAVDPGNRTFPVEILLDNIEGLIKPAMIANLRIVRNSLSEAIVVPQQALRYTEDGYVAYIAVSREQGDVAEKRNVTVGPSYGNRIVVTSGLQAGDQLITKGQVLVAQGSRVEVVNRSGGLQP